MQTTTRTRAPWNAALPWATWRRRSGPALLAWGGVSLLTTQVIATYLPLTGQGEPTWLGVFLWTLPNTLLWGLLTPPVLTLAERVRWDRAPLPTFVALHAAAAISIHLLVALVGWSLEPTLRSSVPQLPLAAALVDGSVFDAMRYLVLVAGSHAVGFRSMYQQQQAEALKLRAELLESELHVLRMQLQPHFLFNALHAISELAYRDARLADRAITRLADLLRGSLSNQAEQEIALGAELELLEAYLDIERLRAGDRLVLRTDAPTELHDVLVPNLLLQPLVENALRHGVRGRALGHVTIRVQLEGAPASGSAGILAGLGGAQPVAVHGEAARLELVIDDDGVGLREDWNEGLGLRSTRARLQALYGERHALELVARPGGGTRVRVRLPVRRATAAAGGRTRGRAPAQEAGSGPVFKFVPAFRPPGVPESAAEGCSPSSAAPSSSVAPRPTLEPRA